MVRSSADLDSLFDVGHVSAMGHSADYLPF